MMNRILILNYISIQKTLYKALPNKEKFPQISILLHYMLIKLSLILIFNYFRHKSQTCKFNERSKRQLRYE